MKGEWAKGRRGERGEVSHTWAKVQAISIVVANVLSIALRNSLFKSSIQLRRRKSKVQFRFSASSKSSEKVVGCRGRIKQVETSVVYDPGLDVQDEMDASRASFVRRLSKFLLTRASREKKTRGCFEKTREGF